MAIFESLDPERAGDRELLTLTRGDEIEVVSNLVLAAKASILYAFSGNGKTSLIDAGVIPHMHKAGFAVFKTRPQAGFGAGGTSGSVQGGDSKERVAAAYLARRPGDDCARQGVAGRASSVGG